MTDAPAGPTRTTDLALARIHLRLGSLALARAELEALAGRDGLDGEGLVDLAEVRWRTGDIAGAGEAATAALDDDEGPIIALVVAAEAAAAKGRPTEARRLATKALAAAEGSVDAIFAGMPRATAWPTDPMAPPPSPTTLFDPPPGAARAAARVRRGRAALEAAAPPATGSNGAGAGADIAATTGLDPAAAAPAAALADPDGTMGLWGVEATPETRVGSGLSDALAAAAEAQAEAELEAATHEPDPLEELDRARAAFDADRPDEAALRASVVLRLAPSLAPAVLDLVADRAGPGFALVRGDAYRLVGRELEARRAFTDAVRLADPTPLVPPTPGPDDPTDDTPGDAAEEPSPAQAAEPGGESPPEGDPT